MVERADEGGQSPEAAFLRRNWNVEQLGRYEGEWIAVLGAEVIGHSTDAETLLDETASRWPLFAFVTFEDMQ
jgi:hypothetical protein